jgi:hypothetical protein
VTTAQVFALDHVMNVSIHAVPPCGPSGDMADYPFDGHMGDANTLPVTECVTQVWRNNIANPSLGRVRRRPTGHDLRSD